jgi:diacylglycerol kinase (ATP)
VVARELGIPRNPEKAAFALLESKPLFWDLGKANGQWFLAMIGVGLDANIVHSVTGSRNKLLRLTASGIRQLVKPPSFELSVEADGVPVGGSIRSFVVCNTRNYGGWFSLAPEARATDGSMEGVALLRLDRRAILRFVGSAWRRKQASPSVAQIHKGNVFQIDSLDPKSPVPVQADGDPLGITPVTVEVFPRALRIFAPASAHKTQKTPP